MFEQVNELRFVGMFAGNKLKEFHLRLRLELDYIPNQKQGEISSFDDFLTIDDNGHLSNVPNDFDF